MHQNEMAATSSGPPDDPKYREDWALAQRIKAGDREAFTEAFDRYAPYVYTVAVRMLQSPMPAEDVVQDVYRDLPRRLRTYRGKGSLQKWLCRCALSTALMYLRQDRKDNASELKDTHPDRREFDPVNRITLDDCLQKLPPKYREVLLMFDVMGYSHRETADELDITVQTSRVRLCRARNLLRDLMSR